MKPVSQAVVTDPGGGSQGYSLVAASPGLASVDAEFLERSPGVSEYLHTAKKPRPCFSFHRLPSGAWALSRRFVSGRRRGEYNRVVAHTLVFGDELLTALAVEPSLLTSRCIYRPANPPTSSSVEFFELSKTAADPKLEALPDLLCQPPDELEQALKELVHQRCKYLRRSLTAADLEARLRQIFATLERGERVLLPQQSTAEELLRLAWSALPPDDRRRVAWTTHYAPGFRVAFLMANAPDLRRGHEGWRVIEGSSGADEPSASAGASGLAAAVTRDGPMLAARLAEESRQLSLLEGRGAIARWLRWTTHWAHQIEEGCSSLEELERFYAEVGQASKIDPWIETGSIVHCTVRSLCRIAASGDRDAALEAVHGALARCGLQARVLAVGQLEALARETFGERQALALALALRDLRLRRPPPQGRDEREALFLALVAGRRIGGDPAVTEILLESSFELLDCDSPTGDRILSYLARNVPAAFGRAAGRWAAAHRPPRAAAHRPLRAAAALIGVLRGDDGAWQPLLDGLLAGVLIPGLRPSGGALDPDLLRFTLSRARPELLAASLRLWRGEPYALAVEVLRGWIDSSPAAARKTAEHLDPDSQLEPARILVGLSRRLRSLGTNATRWIPFAVAEASWLDRDGSPKELALTELVPLAEARLSAAEAEPCLPVVLAALSRNAAGAGRCHRALLALVVESSPDFADETVGALEALFSAVLDGPRANGEILRWEAVVRDVVSRLRGRGKDEHASVLLAHYWRALAQVDALPPSDLIATLDDLRPNQRQPVVRAWRRRLEALAASKDGSELAVRLARLARPDAEIVKTVRRARLRAETSAESHDLVRRINEYHGMAGGDLEALRSFLHRRALPGAKLGRAIAVLSLLTAKDDLWPEIYEVLEKDLLSSAILEVLDQSPAWLRSVERLTGREALLIGVAEQLGQRSRKDPGLPIEFLEWALSISWSEVREPFGRDLFIATLLRASEGAREKPRDLIEDLYERRRADLLEPLLALASGAGRLFLRDRVAPLTEKVALLHGSRPAADLAE